MAQWGLRYLAEGLGPHPKPEVIVHFFFHDLMNKKKITGGVEKTRVFRAFSFSKKIIFQVFLFRTDVRKKK